MQGNLHVPFLGGWVGAIPPGYPAHEETYGNATRLVPTQPRYCWPTYFKVLGVLFLEEVSSAFLPSKKVCWTHKFRYVGVGQQYLMSQGSPPRMK
jgi:hypothetical protein